MKKVIPTDKYIFDPENGTITLSKDYDMYDTTIVLVVNQTDSKIIYSFGCDGKGGTISKRTLDLEFDTSNMSMIDDLMIIVFHDELSKDGKSLIKTIEDQARQSQKLLSEISKAQSNANQFKRITAGRRLNLGFIGTTELPLVSIKRKSAFESVSVKSASIDIITDADVIVELRAEATLTGAFYETPTNYSANETAVEVDNSATAISAGNPLFSTLVKSSGAGPSTSGSASIPLTDVDFKGLTPVTVTIRTVSGSGATASCIFRVVEEW